MFPTITTDGNDVWVAYQRFWETPEQELNLQHGVWDEATETMTWWSGGNIKQITQSTASWLSGSMFPDSDGNIHIAYTQCSTFLIQIS